MPAIRAQTAVSPTDGTTPGFWVLPSWGDGAWVGVAQAAWGINQGMSSTQIRNAILAVYVPLLSVPVADEWQGRAPPPWHTRAGRVVTAQLVGLTVEVLTTNPLAVRFTSTDGASSQAVV